jgi:hypothetical protein
MGHFTLLNLGIFTLLFLTFGKCKPSKSLFFKKSLNFDFHIWAIYHQQKEKATEYMGATFFSQGTSAKLHSKKFKEDYSFAYS